MYLKKEFSVNNEWGKDASDNWTNELDQPNNSPRTQGKLLIWKGDDKKIRRHERPIQESQESIMRFLGNNNTNRGAIIIVIKRSMNQSNNKNNFKSASFERTMKKKY